MTSSLESVQYALQGIINNDFEAYNRALETDHLLFIRGEGPFALSAVGTALGHRNNALFVIADGNLEFFRPSDVTAVD